MFSPDQLSQTGAHSKDLIGQEVMRLWDEHPPSMLR
jgi:hypothetical protein